MAQAAAPTVKRVHQKLGGKSPSIILRSADYSAAVAAGGRRRSGNGREYGKFGLHEFTEIKGIVGVLNE